MKHFISIIYMLFASAMLSNCSTKSAFIENSGSVFGTYYSIVYESQKNYNDAFDSIFMQINNAVSSYQLHSEISRFNTQGFLNNPSPILLEQLKSAAYYHQITNGAFEPTLLPLIEVWGFGLKKRTKVEGATIDSLLPLISFTKNISFNKKVIKANKPGVQLSLTSMGEGYTLNKIASFLDHKGIENYKVELGGEVKCKGKNEHNEVWRIGISNPLYDLEKSPEELTEIIILNNNSLSTSGSYRKFYIDEHGRKKTHIIDPKTGYPVTHNLLSVSIKCPDAEKADALSTACMVMGVLKAKQFIKEQKDIEGFLIFENDKKELETWASTNFYQIVYKK